MSGSEEKEKKWLCVGPTRDKSERDGRATGADIKAQRRPAKGLFKGQLLGFSSSFCSPKEKVLTERLVPLPALDMYIPGQVICTSLVSLVASVKRQAFFVFPFLLLFSPFYSTHTHTSTTSNLIHYCLV